MLDHVHPAFHQDPPSPYAALRHVSSQPILDSYPENLYQDFKYIFHVLLQYESLHKCKTLKMEKIPRYLI